jgi:hypothetical protein
VIDEPAPREPRQTEPEDIDVAAAERSLVDNDALIETGEVDGEGSLKIESARESIAAARAEVATAQREAKGYEAAVACLLSYGD